ncbi:MAG: hypothetical protein Q8M55_01080 [Actinomycetota bacterium]|nr:hypothetical protein [Actinomycetota bacterium]
MQTNSESMHDRGEAVPPPPVQAVRDAVVDCFTSTHYARFGASREELGLDTHTSAVRESVEGIVRLAFLHVGGNYDTPTVGSIIAVVNLLAERSLEWGVEDDVVFDHHCAMLREIGLLLIRSA